MRGLMVYERIARARRPAGGFAQPLGRAAIHGLAPGIGRGQQVAIDGDPVPPPGAERPRAACGSGRDEQARPAPPSAQRPFQLPLRVLELAGFGFSLRGQASAQCARVHGVDQESDQQGEHEGDHPCPGVDLVRESRAVQVLLAQFPRGGVPDPGEGVLRAARAPHVGEHPKFAGQDDDRVQRLGKEVEGDTGRRRDQDQEARRGGAGQPQ
ncbi:hypothetical protein BJF83_23525 [Nocardiopsis sp. CNR-923]|nr:hypothetical protein BJF83_23525 [Nocardiopsis sp. CNR-923]